MEDVQGATIAKIRDPKPTLTKASLRGTGNLYARLQYMQLPPQDC